MSQRSPGQPGGSGQENKDNPLPEDSSQSSDGSSSTCASSDTISPTSQSSSTSTGSSQSTNSVTSAISGTNSSDNVDDDGDDDHHGVSHESHRHRMCQSSRYLERCDQKGTNQTDLHHPNHDKLKLKQGETGQTCDSPRTIAPQSSLVSFPTSSVNRNVRHDQRQIEDRFSSSQPILRQASTSSSTSNQQPKSTTGDSNTCGNVHRCLASSSLTTSDVFSALKPEKSTKFTPKLEADKPSDSSICSNNSFTATIQSRSHESRPHSSRSPSLPTTDTNNNSKSSLPDNLFGSKRINFSKSSSGSRLIDRARASVCDCLTQASGEKKHSNRRHYIEHYYSSRMQFPSANPSNSAFNISTPLNKLSECDAITRRLLSSPIRSTHNIESTESREQVSEPDKSRRASLGTNTITDQVFLLSSSPFRSLELGCKKNLKTVDNQRKLIPESTNSISEADMKLKQQGRSLSICEDETLNSRHRYLSSNYSPNLGRAVSLAGESGHSTVAKRLLTIIPLFGCDMKSLEQFNKLNFILPPVIDSAVDFIVINGVNSIGIFRKSGVKSRILALKQRIEANQDTKFDEINRNNEFSIYDIADLVKMWFRELRPTPLISKELTKFIASYVNNPSNACLKHGSSSQLESRRTNPNLREAVKSLTSPVHRALLRRAMNFLAQISANCAVNQMTSANLAICLAPSLCAIGADQNSILTAQRVLEFCIDENESLFGQD